MSPRASSSKPLSAAAYWHTRRRTNVMSVQDIAAFNEWLERDPAHQRAYARIERAWLISGEVEDDPALLEARDHDEAALHARGERRVFVAMAAGLVFALAGGWALWRSGAIGAINWFAPAPAQEFRTSIGQRATFTLLDGSTVTLDTNSALRARLTGRERRIELAHGRAFFQVAKDKSRPFLVSADGKIVRATGTAFDVRFEEGRFAVTLVEGRVRVKEEGAPRGEGPVADMRQGWRLAVAEDAQWRMAPVDIVRETSWHEGMLIFNDTPLAEAVAEMNRYSRRKLVFRGPPPSRLMLGRFPAGDVESFASAVELNKMARVVSRSKEEIELAAP